MEVVVNIGDLNEEWKDIGWPGESIIWNIATH